MKCAVRCLRCDLVLSGTSIVVRDLADRVDLYRAAVADAGYRAVGRVPSSLSPSKPPTSSREAFEAFARLAAAPTVLALIDLYAEQARLRDRDDFAVSCLPRNNRTPTGQARATAISVGWVEVFVATIDRANGNVSEVAVWAEPDADLEPLDAWPSVEFRESHLDGGGLALIFTGTDAPVVLADPRIAPIISERIAGIRSRRRRARRHDWHNRWLWALVESGVASSPSRPGVITDDDDVSAPDAFRFVRQRTSQQQFRALLLDRQVNECVICGIDVLDVLEAAHLVPHAKGGTASLDNGRLLCANHHRAYDAGLYRWNGAEFTWIGEGPEIILGARGSSTS